MPDQDLRIGELALAEGLASLQQIVQSAKRREETDASLGELLVDEHGVDPEAVARLQERIDCESDELVSALERGETIAEESIYRTGDSRPSPKVATTYDTPPETIRESRDSQSDEQRRSAPSLDQAPSRRTERYEFESPLGEGGMGKVMLAHDDVMSREIALKTLRSGDDLPRLARERLIHEARLTARLEHPNIVPTYDLGELPDGQPYYTMRVVREESLNHILHRRRVNDEDRYSLTQLVGFLRQIALAVEYAHDSGVIHRDIKPENILIGSYGEVFIIDWGIAKVTADEPTHHTTGELLELEEGAVVGTPYYMPPEQAQGDHDAITEASDVYSLGAVLYEILTGVPPFEAERTLSLLFKVVQSDPTPPSQRRPDAEIPRELEEICMKALQKNPADRYESAQAMADELEMFIEGVKERERRHEMALEATEEADQARENYREIRQELVERRERLRELKIKTRSWAPPGEKEELWAVEQAVQDLQVKVERAFGEATRLYGQALGHEPDMSRAREALAELYWRRFEEHEAAGEHAQAAYFEGLVRQYNDGQYDELLEGRATLTVESSPIGAEATLYEYEEVNRRFVERKTAELGPTPIGETELSHGSYVVECRAPGYRTTSAPVVLERDSTESISVPLFRPDQVPEDFVVVPGGPYRTGDGDRSDDGTPDPTVPTFAIQRCPVTCREYVEFLNDLHRRDPERARSHAPHIEGEESYFPIKDGEYVIPEHDKDGDSWEPDWPICLVNLDDAQAYADWKTANDPHGRQYRLPAADEWEKAARGVDGRLYPWGNHFDASFCNMKASRRGRPLPAEVGTFPIDRSPYGAMDMAGNIIEWTSTPVVGDDRYVMQGANYRAIGLMCRLDWQMESLRTNRSSHYGFRLALDLSEVSPDQHRVEGH